MQNTIPGASEAGRIQMKTTTIDTFMKREAMKTPSLYNFWNFDIQGAELLALKGRRRV